MSRPKLVAFPHAKGGVGSTSIVSNLGAVLAAKGRRVLLLDCDPFGGLSFALLDRPPEATLDDCLAARSTIAEAAIEVADRLALVASSPGLAAWDRREQRLPVDLARVLDQVEGFEVVLIDCPAGLSTIARSVLALIPGGRVAAVLQPRGLDLAGLADLLGAIEDLSEQNPKLALRAIIPNRVTRHRYVEEIVDALRAEHRGLVLPGVREAAAIAKAPLAHRPVVETNPNSGAAEDVRALARAFAAKVLRD